MQLRSAIPGTMTTGYQSLISEQSVQTTNKAETQLGPVPKQTSHTRTHTMGAEKEENSSKSKVRGEKKQAAKLAPYAVYSLLSPHPNM